MKPEQQRIVIAEECGWEFKFEDDGSVTVISPSKQLRSSWFPQDHSGRHVAFRIANLPDYLNDLNSMHEAEKVLSNSLWYKYRHEINAIVLHDDSNYWRDERNLVSYCIHATASQRAEAFLKTIGKWVEE